MTDLLVSDLLVRDVTIGDRPGQAVLPTSRWPKTVGRVTLVPLAYLAVPPPLEVSTVVPAGLIPNSENFQPMKAAAASTVACGTGTTS